MSQYKATYLCWFCGTDIVVPVVEDKLTSYEMNKSNDGRTIKESYSAECSGCHVVLHVSFKQFRNASLAKLAAKKGRD